MTEFADQSAARTGNLGTGVTHMDHYTTYDGTDLYE
jgi:hypothetical protein